MVVVVRAHEETEVHDEYDDHTHDEESATTTTITDTATRVEGGGDDGNNVKDPSWSYLHATTLPHPLSDVSIAKMKTHEGQLVIVLTGGCNSPNGNELVMEEWGEGFSCKNITSQVMYTVHSNSHCRPYMLYVVLLCYNLSVSLSLSSEHTHRPQSSFLFFPPYIYRPLHLCPNA